MTSHDLALPRAAAAGPAPASLGIILPRRPYKRRPAPRLARLCFAAPALALSAGALALSAPGNAAKPRAGFEAALPVAPVPTTVRPATGAIFDAGLGYASLVQGTLARRVGDPLTILLDENTTTAKSAGSKTSRNGGFSLTPPSAGPLSFLPATPRHRPATQEATKSGGQPWLPDFPTGGLRSSVYVADR